MNISTVISQLRTYCPMFSGRVAGSAEFDPLKDSVNLPVPAAYVIRLDDRPGEPMALNDVQQPIYEGFGVVVAFSNTADERGQTPAMDIDDIRGELFKALIGWRITQNHGGIAYDGMALLHRDRSRIWYQFEFSTLTYIGPEDGWQDEYLSTLPDFAGSSHPDPQDPDISLIGMAVDVIDPIAKPLPGPDGRIEFILDEDL